MWPVLVERGDELVDVLLELVECVGWGLLAEPFFEGLFEAFNFAAGGGVAWGGVFLPDSSLSEVRFEGVSAVESASAGSEFGGENHAVIGQC